MLGLLTKSPFTYACAALGRMLYEFDGAKMINGDDFSNVSVISIAENSRKTRLYRAAKEILDRADLKYEVLRAFTRWRHLSRWVQRYWNKYN